MNAGETIHSFFTADHDRLDDLFKEFQKNKTVNYAQAKNYFREFKQGLERHIQWEEEVLFPFFEEKTGMAGCGPTEVMRREHVQIKEALARLLEKAHRNDPESGPEERALLIVLGEHNSKEEEILYPMLDQMSEEKEKKGIFKRMKETPLKTCCCED